LRIEAGLLHDDGTAVVKARSASPAANSACAASCRLLMRRPQARKTYTIPAPGEPGSDT
jgi:hypothetical protein